VSWRDDDDDNDNDDFHGSDDDDNDNDDFHGSDDYDNDDFHGDDDDDDNDPCLSPSIYLTIPWLDGIDPWTLCPGSNWLNPG